jgi:hypothetical protein
MLTANGPKVLEFNARFGDPETQVYLVRLENDLVDLLEACLDQTLSQHKLKWRTEAAVCVVMASGGYPGEYAKGLPIAGIEKAEEIPNVKVFHAGTALKDGKPVTAGGRVLGVTALGRNIRTAREVAYRAVDRIQFQGAHFRRDIAVRGLSLETQPEDCGTTPPRGLREEIREHPFLRGLSEEQIDLLTECAMRSRFNKGEQIFREGDPANRFYLLKTGKVAIESAKDGGITNLQFIGEGDVLGWSWLFPPYVWLFDARAVEPTEAIFLYGTRVRELCEVKHDLGYELMKRTASTVMARLMAVRKELVSRIKSQER